MNRYFLRNRILAPLFAVALLCGCVDNESFFGNGMIPPSQIMSTEVDSSFRFDTYTVKIDSLKAITSLKQSIGELIDPLVGSTKMSIFTNYAPWGFAEEGFFGPKAAVDSILLGMTFMEPHGDTTKTLTIDVFEVNGYYFNSDSTYYTNFSMDRYIKKDAPLLTFEVKNSNLVVVKHLPKWFGEKLMDNTQSNKNVYLSDTGFHRRYNGLYFRVRPVVGGNKGIAYNLSLSGSSMTLWYHNFKGDTLNDSLSQKLIFWDANQTPHNTNLMLIGHDFSTADPSRGGVRVSSIGDTMTVQERCYIQGMAGLSAKVRFRKDDFERLKKEVQSKGFKNIAIHRAELRWDMVEKTATNYDEAWQKLVLYFNVNQGKYLPDYDGFRDVYDSQNYTSNIGGLLSRSVGYYSQDITGYVQRLFTGSITNYDVQLLPDFGKILTYARSVVYGSASDNPPLLILTYTMIK
ncbi:MAG: DUF4270 family protein [Mucinivorans sp.]